MQNYYKCKQIFGSKCENECNSLITNDQKVLFSGTESETGVILQSDAVTTDFGSGIILPSFKAVNVDILKLIENEIKNAKFEKNSEKFDPNIAFDIKTCDFSELKSAFCSVQERFLKGGADTLIVPDMDDFLFDLIKKFSEKKLLKIDILCYVSLSNKHILDENCKSFRSYKGGLRLGGLCVSLDGYLHQGKAWTAAAYRHSQGYKGYGQVQDEQLCYVLKSAMAEKKQVWIKAFGERAVDQFLRCYEETIKDNQAFENQFFVETTGLISRKQIEALSSKKVGILVDLEPLVCHFVSLGKQLGLLRSRRALSLKKLLKESSGVAICYGKSESGQFKLFEFLCASGSKKLPCGALGKGLEQALKLSVENLAEMTNENQKGTLETGKNASFVVADDINFWQSGNLRSGYICDEKVF